MATRETNRPYAYPGNVMDVLQRYRSLDLPETVESNDLAIIGVPQGNHGRTLFALKFLGLLQEDNTPTSAWRALCDAGEEDFRSQLAALVRAAYSDVLQQVQPDKDDQSKVRTAFQRFTPKSQIDRMATFFLSMCREGGMAILDAPKRRPTKVRSGGSGSPRRGGNERAAGKPKVEPPANGTSSLFGVTEEDIGLLDQQDFDELWTALGKVARARAKARQQRSASAQAEDESA